MFIELLKYLNSLTIVWCILLEYPEVIELTWIFPNASEIAYSTAVYCKSITAQQKILVKLISSKLHSLSIK